MFNLIITIISIALVAVLAIATIYYGGAAFTQGSAKAGAATLVSHAQQMAAANTLYANDHGGEFTTNATATGAGSLVSEYLTALPVSPNAAAYTFAAANRVESVLPVASANICIEVNKTLDANATDVPLTAIVSTTPAKADILLKQYGCVDTDGATGADMTFFYKG